MKDLTKKEIRQRFIQYFKELEEGQGHKQLLFEDQLLPIIAKLTTPSNQYIDWLLSFSDITKVRQEFLPYPPYYNRSSEEFFFQIMNALEGDGVARKKQFLDFICKKVQMRGASKGHPRSLQNNQHLKKELDEQITNEKAISGEFIFKLYQQKYVHLKEPNISEEINAHLIQTFSDKNEEYIVQRLQHSDFLSAIRLILLKDLASQDIENIIANNSPINDQDYYNYMNLQIEATKKVLFDKLFNKDQYFINIITKIILSQRLSYIFGDRDKEYITYLIQLALYRERKDLIAFYIWSDPGNIIKFLKECGFISPTDKEFELSLTDEKLTPDTGKHILKIYEQKFFIDPLKRIAQEKNIPFDEEGFYQIRQNKEEGCKHIYQLPICALDIAFLLADGIALSNQEHGHKLRELTLQARKTLSSLKFSLYHLSDFIVSVLKITEDYYPQFKKRYQFIRQSVVELLREIELEIEKEQQEKEREKQQEEKEEEERQQEPKSILIKTIRIKGFRGLENIEIDLEKTTVLTGANNTGKSSILYALKIVFGNHQFISQDDFFIKGDSTSQEIIIDTLIVPVDDEGNICNNFTDDWASVFGQDRIRLDPNDPNKSMVPFRTKIEFDSITNSFKKQQFPINGWPKFKDNSTNWFDKDNEDEKFFYFDEIPFFYIDAQRDVLKDIKLKSSYLGKMISKIEYSKDDTEDIQGQIDKLNEQAVEKSDILLTIKKGLEELNSMMGTNKDSIEITPFTKKVRDLNKGLSIYYADQKDSFSMEYHGMGTRSWSSLLTLKTFISSLMKKFQKQENVFFPILAIEEPEAHLHPNAQKQLYHQIKSIEGQKIISTHSPYVAARAEIKQVRGLYKKERVACGKVTGLSSDNESKIKTHVMRTHGEMIFSKLIIFSEGQTESQALPIFAEKFFGKHPSDMGLNFVEVRGKGYSPFIQFAESLKIPWLIFSDADQNTVEEVEKQTLKVKENPREFIVFLDEGENFETQLISDGYDKEFKEAIIILKNFSNKKANKIRNLTKDELKAEFKKEKSRDKLIRIDQAIFETLPSELKEKKISKQNLGINKALFAPIIAKQIINSNKSFPPKIEELFEKIKAHYKREG